MTLKQFCSKKSLTSELFFDKKLINKSLYGKLMIRTSESDLASSYLIDNDTNFFNISSNSLQTFTQNSLQSPVGHSFYAKDFIYTNRLNDSLRFKSYTLQTQSPTFSFINSFNKLLETIKNQKRVGSLLILNPVKGGFTCYTSGIVGFLPYSQAVITFFNIFSFFKKKSIGSNNVLSYLNFLTNKKHFLRNLFVLRLMHWWGKIVIYPPYKRKNFARAQINKKRQFSIGPNFVFLADKFVKRKKK